MADWTKDYIDILKYPEFDYEKIIEKWTTVIDENPAGEPIVQTPDFVFDVRVALDYILFTYAPESPYARIKDMRERKEMALKQTVIPKQFHKKIISNENPMIGDMLTRFFRVYEDFDYELLISGKEALITLLEVVRKPIDSRLLDDKERMAVKAKRECFEDAKYLMGEMRKMLSELRDKEPDAADAAKSSVFKGGFAEKMAR